MRIIAKHQKPPWVNHHVNRQIYHEAARQRRLGIPVEVDHLVPLNSPYVCGLHWHHNLRIVRSCDNRNKSNYEWPDMWVEQIALAFYHKECEQYELPLPL